MSQIYHYENNLDKIISQAITAKCDIQYIKDTQFLKEENPKLRSEQINKLVAQKRATMVSDMLFLIEAINNLK